MNTQLLKLTGLKSFTCPPLSAMPVVVQLGQIIRVSDEQAALCVNEASVNVDEDMNESPWFTAVPDGSKVDHDFVTGTGIVEEKADAPVEVKATSQRVPRTAKK